MKNLIFFIILFCIPMLAISQESVDQSGKDSEPIKRNNIVLTIGHALIPTLKEAGGDKDVVTIPTWGLSYEYRLSQRFLLGLKGELEISNYKIYDNEGSELEREYPFALILYADVRIVKDLYIYAGPGIEFSKDENLFVAAVGLFYEFEIPGGWSIIPEVSFEQKGGHTWAYAIGLGICKIF